MGYQGRSPWLVSVHKFPFLEFSPYSNRNNKSEPDLDRGSINLKSCTLEALFYAQLQIFSPLFSDETVTIQIELLILVFVVSSYMAHLDARLVLD